MDAYPRPQLTRPEWFSLDGEWEFSIDRDAVWESPDAPRWTQRIVVPFSPEAPASGIGDTGLFRACWYRRQFDPPEIAPAQRLLLHFGAVDYEADVWVNGRFCNAPSRRLYTVHRRYHRLSLNGSGSQTVVVRALDDPY